MKRILLSIAFLGSIFPQFSTAFFDTSKAGKLLTEAGTYMVVAATQVALTEVSIQLCRVAMERSENPCWGLGIGGLGISTAVFVGKLRKGGRELSTGALPGDTVTTIAANTGTSGNVILTASTNSWQKAGLDLAFNYSLFKAAHLSKDLGVCFCCSAIFVAKALICHSGQ